MDYQAYREQYFVEPAPESRFGFAGLYGATLFFEAYEQATGYYTQVLGPPAYVEGNDTKGWRIGDTWLTLLRGRSGSPENVEIAIVMRSPEEAERLQAAFDAAGGVAHPPTDALMYEPIRSCPVTDPFGTQIMIYSRLDGT
jgi:hypothetical protein